MATPNAFTKAHLEQVLQLMDTIDNAPVPLSQVRINFEPKVGGRFEYVDNEIVFIPTHYENPDPFGR